MSVYLTAAFLSAFGLAAGVMFARFAIAARGQRKPLPGTLAFWQDRYFDLRAEVNGTTFTEELADASDTAHFDAIEQAAESRRAWKRCQNKSCPTNTAEARTGGVA